MPHVPEHTLPSSFPPIAHHRGSLDNYLAADDIAPLPTFTDAEWDQLRRETGKMLAWRFATLRNLWVHRGQVHRDSLGFARGGIYRTLLVGSIVATSYRNEGHFRSSERIEGTGDFFRGSFLLPAASPEFRELVQLVNLRHHVAGVVHWHDDGGYGVIDGYEADYAYVATSFIESVRRGLALCGVAADSPRGRELGEMYVVLSATAPLFVLHQTEAAPEPRQVATLAAPTVLAMPSRLDVLMIDAERFESLKHESGFRAATAAEVQRRLSLNSALLGTLFDDTAARTGDPRLKSIAQLFRYLTGDSHVALDAVIDLREEATPAECVEALRTQVDAAIAAGGLPPDLERYLGHVVATIG